MANMPTRKSISIKALLTGCHYQGAVFLTQCRHHVFRFHSSTIPWIYHRLVRLKLSMRSTSISRLLVCLIPSCSGGLIFLFLRFGSVRFGVGFIFRFLCCWTCVQLYISPRNVKGGYIYRHLRNGSDGEKYILNLWRWFLSRIWKRKKEIKLRSAILL